MERRTFYFTAGLSWRGGFFLEEFLTLENAEFEEFDQIGRAHV